MVDVWTKRARENNFNRNERLEGCIAFVGLEKILVFVLWLNIACNVFIRGEKYEHRL